MPHIHSHSCTHKKSLLLYYTILYYTILYKVCFSHSEIKKHLIAWLLYYIILYNSLDLTQCSLISDRNHQWAAKQTLKLHPGNRVWWMSFLGSTTASLQVTGISQKGASTFVLYLNFFDYHTVGHSKSPGSGSQWDLNLWSKRLYLLTYLKDAACGFGFQSAWI